MRATPKELKDKIARGTWTQTGVVHAPCPSSPHYFRLRWLTHQNERSTPGSLSTKFIGRHELRLVEDETIHVYALEHGNVIITDKFPDGTCNYVYIDGTYSGKEFAEQREKFVAVPSVSYGDMFALPEECVDSVDPPSAESPPEEEHRSPPRKPRKRRFTIDDIPSGSDSDSVIDLTISTLHPRKRSVLSSAADSASDEDPVIDLTKIEPKCPSHTLSSARLASVARMGVYEDHAHQVSRGGCRFLRWRHNSCHFDSLAFGILFAMVYPREMRRFLQFYLTSCAVRPFDVFLDFLYLMPTSSAPDVLQRREKVTVVTMLSLRIL